jgi:sortase B
MINGSKFADLENFGDIGYFHNNPMGSLFLIDTTYLLEVFAYLRTDREDKLIYGTKTEENFQEFIEHVRTIAINYRDVQLSGEDRFVTLSTCDNDFSDYRFVVLARLVKVDYN